MSVNGAVVLEESVRQLRALWEETSFQLDRLQAEPRCVAEEEQGLRERTGPTYCLPPGFPKASVPREPGEAMCAQSWLPGHWAGGEPTARCQGLPWSRVWGDGGGEGALRPRDPPSPSRWSHSPGCHLARGGQ